MESIEKHFSTDELLTAVKQLSVPELEQFVDQVIALQASRRAPHLSEMEEGLLSQINQGLSENLRARLLELTEKREAETITQPELDELTELTDRVEELHAGRMEALSKLAQQRRTTLEGIMDQLGIELEFNEAPEVKWLMELVKVVGHDRTDSV